MISIGDDSVKEAYISYLEFGFVYSDWGRKKLEIPAVHPVPIMLDNPSFLGELEGRKTGHQEVLLLIGEVGSQLSAWNGRWRGRSTNERPDGDRREGGRERGRERGRESGCRRCDRVHGTMVEVKDKGWNNSVAHKRWGKWKSRGGTCVCTKQAGNDVSTTTERAGCHTYNHTY